MKTSKTILIATLAILATACGAAEEHGLYQCECAPVCSGVALESERFEGRELCYPATQSGADEATSDAAEGFVEGLVLGGCDQATSAAVCTCQTTGESC
jgi:hypothetical protein